MWSNAQSSGSPNAAAMRVYTYKRTLSGKKRKGKEMLMYVKKKNEKYKY